MVKIRLMRVGKRKQPYYRVVVADARSPRDGRFIENIGRYHPRQHPSLIEIDPERALHWLQNGAQPSDPVRVLLQKTGIWGRFTGEGPTEPVAPPEEKPKPAAPAATAEEPEPAAGAGAEGELPAAAEEPQAPAEAEAPAAETAAETVPADGEGETTGEGGSAPAGDAEGSEEGGE